MLQDSDVQASRDRTRARSGSSTSSALADSHGHAVQFYESDAFLVNMLARFVVNGLSRDEPVVVIATNPHVTALVETLRARQVDVDAARNAHQLCMVDAHGLLAAIMEQGMPDVERFNAAFDGILQTVARKASAAGVRVYGEMVDLLWKDGNYKAAIRLEEIWNERASSNEFFLLCAYALRGFPAAEDTSAIAEICRQHTRVTPTERFIEHDSIGRRMQVVLLQQRAQALETELNQRKRLESRLRRTATAAKRAKTAADVANRAKSQFLTVMSHELRTPLNAIGGYTELLELGIHGPVSDDQRDSLERIQRNQRHLLSLINQVLDYSKLETGILRYDIRDVALVQALQTVELAALPRMTAKGLRYVQSNDPTLVARADRDKLQQILLNLLGNATKFTPSGGSIEVACSADESTVYVDVRDTGVGIPEERLATIFAPFVQVETGYARSSDGIGLGLAISRQLARGMNGLLTVVSATGAGSTFTLALPRLVR